MPRPTRPGLRAEAAGADLDRLIVLETADGTPLFFPTRLPELEEAVRAHAADLVVIDPIMAFLPPEIAATLDQCVRLGLGPLAALAGAPIARSCSSATCARPRVGGWFTAVSGALALLLRHGRDGSPARTRPTRPGASWR